MGDTQSCPGQGVPQSCPGQGGVTPCHEVPPALDWDTPTPPGTRVPLTWHWGTPLSQKDMGPVVGSIMGWRWDIPPPPHGVGQTENITFRHPSDADAN